MVAPEQSRAELRARISELEAEVERLLARPSFTLDANVPTMQKVIKQQREQIAAYQDEAERWKKIAGEGSDEVERLREARMFELEDAHSHGFIKGWHGMGDQDVSMNFSWDEYRAALTETTETKEENR